MASERERLRDWSEIMTRRLEEGPWPMELSEGTVLALSNDIDAVLEKSPWRPWSELDPYPPRSIFAREDGKVPVVVWSDLCNGQSRYTHWMPIPPLPDPEDPPPGEER